MENITAEEIKEKVAKEYDFMSYDSMMQAFWFGKAKPFQDVGRHDEINNKIIATFADLKTQPLLKEIEELKKENADFIECLNGQKIDASEYFKMESQLKEMAEALQDLHTQSNALLDHCVDMGFINDDSEGIEDFQKANTKSRVALFNHNKLNKE